MKRFLIFICMVIALAGCGKVRDVKVTSYKIVSITPTSLHSVDVSVDLGVYNPCMGLTLSQVRAQLYNQGTSLGCVTMDPVKVLARTESVYDLTAHIALEPGVSIFRIMSLASKFSPEDYSADLAGKIKLRSGLAKKIELKKIPLSKFINEE